MKSRIADFPANSANRRAAETLAGMKGTGAVVDWYFDDTEGKFSVRLFGGSNYLMPSGDVIWMGRGAIAFMKAAKERLENPNDT